MHPVAIILDVLIVISAIHIWTLIGYIVLHFLHEFETGDNELVNCFFWPMLIVFWIKLSVNEALKDYKENK